MRVVLPPTTKATITHYLMVQVDPQPRSEREHPRHARSRGGRHTVGGVDWIRLPIMMQSLQGSLSVTEDAGGLEQSSAGREGLFECGLFN
jgi:hypothetical protein